MGRTDKKVGYLPAGKASSFTLEQAAQTADDVFRMLEGKWKMQIVFQLFRHKVRRFSELERAIPEVSQKVLVQQLRDLERNALVERTVYPVVPPKVEYRLTDWGQSLCPVMDALLKWRAQHQSPATAESEGAGGD